VSGTAKLLSQRVTSYLSWLSRKIHFTGFWLDRSTKYTFWSKIHNFIGVSVANSGSFLEKAKFFLKKGPKTFGPRETAFSPIEKKEKSRFFDSKSNFSPISVEKSVYFPAKILFRASAHAGLYQAKSR